MDISLYYSYTYIGKRDRHGQMKQKPEVIHQYNQNMGAVDRSDQMVAYSSFKRWA